MRTDSRKMSQMRKIVIRKGHLKNAIGSCLIEMGQTHVLCTASVEDSVPAFLKGKGRGWLTAEYGMLPGCSRQRIARESSKGKVSGRTHEIQRLIGRSLRAVTDLEKIGERTIWIDTDVLQADGGTRTAAITGGFIALADAFRNLVKADVIAGLPLRDYVAAVSVGVVDGKPLLDLSYEEDSRAEVDMNVVMTGSGQFIEVQGTAERDPFSQAQLDLLLKTAKKGIRELVRRQQSLVSI
ncbi:MAG: ribonuclease PH [Omnitrophica bacterium GWA2_52_8]|nr:MAG: ribonuclease PH [Omnitrophica bacterium GWA2_52_8]